MAANNPKSIDLGRECVRLLLREQAAGRDRIQLDLSVREALYQDVLTPARPVPSSRPAATPAPAVSPAASSSPVPVPAVSRNLSIPAALSVAPASSGFVAVPVQVLPGDDWAALAAKVAGCRACPLCQARRSTVFGEGDQQARLMFIGEGPGEEEDLQGRPFVGRAGQFLTRMIEAMGVTREQVYIANIVKCRPPGNREPQREEALVCLPYLERQIALVKPEAIVTLGNVPLQWLLGQKGITRMRGQWHDWRGIPVMPTYHPSYIIRLEGMEREKDIKRDVWTDLKQVMARLGLNPRK
jgi:DNA polymerase